MSRLFHTTRHELILGHSGAAPYSDMHLLWLKNRIFRCLVLCISFYLCLLKMSFGNAEVPELKVGVLLPLSGPYAPVGKDNQEGIEIAKLEIDPLPKLKFIFADSKSDPTQSVSEFRKLTSIDGVQVVFLCRGPVGMAVNPLSLNGGVPLLGGVANKEFALTNKYAFQLNVRSDIEGSYLASKIRALGFKRVVMVTVQDDYPTSVSSEFKRELNRDRKMLIDDQEVLPTDNDFRAIIAKIRTLDPDAVFVNLGINQIGPFVMQLRELGSKAQVFSNFWSGKKDVIASAGQAGEGVMFAQMSTNLPLLKEELKNRFKSNPSTATLSAYVGTIMIAQAAKGLKNITTKNLYANLLEQREIKTRNGVFRVEDRFVQFPMSLNVIKNGTIEEVGN